MVGDIVGYCIIKSDANFKFAMDDKSGNFFDSRSDEEKKVDLKKIWTGKPIRCLEINEQTNSFLVISNDANKMGMFDKKDVERYFHCKETGGVILPAKLDPIEEMAYYSKAIQRKGGYNNIVKMMVVAASLHRGEFCDSVLWDKQ